MTADGGSPGDGAAGVELRPPLGELLRSDYAVLGDVHALLSEAGHPQLREGRMAGRLNAARRFATSSSLRAALLFRLAARASPKSHWFWRSALLALHSCDVMPGARIGPGLRLPHPHGITLGFGVQLGSNVTLAHHVTLGSDLRYSGQPRIGDGVRILSGSVVAGPVEIGDGALIGANCVILDDVEAGAVIGAGSTIQPRG